jgi:hypothetical protein
MPYSLITSTAFPQRFCNPLALDQVVIRPCLVPGERLPTRTQMKHERAFGNDDFLGISDPGPKGL